jgi:hypothetical protein
MMLVLCPTCKELLPCDQDANCIERVPSHGDCPTTLGFVYPYNPYREPPADYAPPKNNTDPRYKR